MTPTTTRANCYCHSGLATLPCTWALLTCCFPSLLFCLTLPSPSVFVCLGHMQCMSAAWPLTRYFISDKYKADLNPDNVLGTST